MKICKGKKRKQSNFKPNHCHLRWIWVLHYCFSDFRSPRSYLFFTNMNLTNDGLQMATRFKWKRKWKKEFKRKKLKENCITFGEDFLGLPKLTHMHLWTFLFFFLAINNFSDDLKVSTWWCERVLGLIFKSMSSWN